MFNKCDKLVEDVVLSDPNAEKTLRISAKEKIGLENFDRVLTEYVNAGMVYVDRLFSFAEAGMVSKMHASGMIEEEYREDGIYVKGFIKKELGIK